MSTPILKERPGLVTAIGLMTLASGITNLFWGFIASATALGTIVGVICLPVAILPTILGIFEIIYAAKLLSAQPQPVGPSPSIAAFQISTVVMGNVFSLVVGILALIFYNDMTVRNYFEGTPMQTPPTPPPALVEPAPEEGVVIENAPASQEADTSSISRKKPGIRKIA